MPESFTESVVSTLQTRSRVPVSEVAGIVTGIACH